MAGIYPPRPMTTEEMEAARQRMLDARYQADRMPSNIGQGLASLGDAISYRGNMQALQGQGASLQQQKPIAQRIVEALSGNKMPWQFPEAPTIAGQQAPKPSYQPRQSVVQSQRAAPAVTAPVTKIDPAKKPEPYFFEHFFKPKSGGGTGGLW